MPMPVLGLELGPIMRDANRSVLFRGVGRIRVGYKAVC